MNKNINIDMIHFEQQLQTLISNSQLPIGVVYYILWQYWNKLQDQYYYYIQQYNIQQNQEKQEDIMEKQSTLDESDS